ncbi:MAG TPA: triose-phosphate isomerase [Candidatus Dormibacteraeota bacterium]
MNSSSKPLMAANWKMNPVDPGDAADLIRAVVASAAEHPDVDVVVCPPFPWLLGVHELLEGSQVALGGQDCFWEESGAYTGAVSAAMLAQICAWVIVGHSERRLYFAETDETVAKKAAAALANGLTAIVCVGETLLEHEDHETDAVVERQLRAGLAECSADDSPRLVIAYEPIWAIGTGRNAEPEHAYRTMRVIRSTVAAMIGAGAARRVRVLYGGSTNAGNVESYVGLPNCDGCLVGGASLKADEFGRMIEVTSGLYSKTAGARG